MAPWLRLSGLVGLLGPVSAQTETCGLDGSCAADETTLLQGHGALKSLRIGQHNAKQQTQPTCHGIFEAEDASIAGAVEHAAVNSPNHQGFTGRSFVDFLHPNDDSVEWTLTSCNSGTATVSVRYALAHGNRPLRVLVNGQVAESELDFPGCGGGDWKTYCEVSLPVELQSGTNTVKLLAVGSSGANVDSLSVTSWSQTYEAEDATIVGAKEHVQVNSPNHQGFTGRSFVDFLNSHGDSVEWNVLSGSGATATATFRYALAHGNRPLRVVVNGEVASASLDFPGCGGGDWKTYCEVSVPVELATGANSVKLEAIGHSGANVDSLTITACAQRYEAEDASIAGAVEHAAVNSPNHQGFTGRSFVDFLHPNDDYVRWSFRSSKSGTATATFRYALAHGNRPLRVVVNGDTASPSLAFPGCGAGNWKTYCEVSLPIELQTGVNTLSLEAIGSSGANVDSLSISACDSLYEAEDAIIVGAVEHAAVNSPAHQGFTGRSFVDFLHPNDDSVEWTVKSCGGTATATFHYALRNGNRPLRVEVNGEVASASLDFLGCGGGDWKTYCSVSLPVVLTSGSNSIKLVAIGHSGANVDSLAISACS